MVEQNAPRPRRIQRRRTKGWRMPEGAVNVTRPSDWSNPYRVGDIVHIETPSVFDPGAHYVYSPYIDAAVAVLLFRIWVSGRLEEQIRAELAGKDLACWCPIGWPCHADVLLDLANGGVA